MFSSRGIAVDSYARIEGDCPMTCRVVAGEAEFDFGDRSHALHLVIEDEALRRLSGIVNDAVSKLGLPPGLGPQLGPVAADGVDDEQGDQQ